MNSKAIKSVLSKKHKEFCESITDIAVRNLVEKNSIITGGAIVSLLTNEEVNDFDIYFRDHETTLVVAQYFVSKFRADHPQSNAMVVVGQNINRIQDIECEDKEFIEKLKEKISKWVPKDSPIYDENRIRIWIQSQGVEGEFQAKEDNPNDLGVELDEEKQEEISEKYKPVWLSSNAITLSGKVQLIVRFYGEPEEIHKNYDFVHCTCSWNSGSGKLELPSKALESILTKQLFYVGSKYPLCSIIRTRKFISRGYTINAGQYLKMAMQLNELNLMDINILEDQLVGVDSTYFNSLIRQIKDKQANDSDFTWGTNYVTSIIDKIF